MFFSEKEPNRRLVEHLEEAEKRRRSGDNHGALKELDLAISLEPLALLAYYLRACIRKELGDSAGALEDADKLIELAPELAPGYGIRAIIREAIGDEVGAREDRKEMNLLEPEEKEGARDEAVELIEEVFRVYEEKDTGRAFALAERAIELYPEFEWAYYVKACLLRDREDFEGAHAALKKGIEINSECAELYYARAIVRDTLGFAQGAKADINRAINLSDSCAVYYQVRAHLRMGSDKVRALVDAQRAIELDPEDELAREIRKRIIYCLAVEEGFLRDLSEEEDPHGGKLPH